jgi:flagellar protein FlbD
VITVHKINHQAIIVNCELIETIEFAQDTVITLTSGSKIIVEEKPDDIIRKTIEFKKLVSDGHLMVSATSDAEIKG